MSYYTILSKYINIVFCISYFTLSYLQLPTRQEESTMADIHQIQIGFVYMLIKTFSPYNIFTYFKKGKEIKSEKASAKT